MTDTTSDRIIAALRIAQERDYFDHQFCRGKVVCELGPERDCPFATGAEVNR